MEDVERVQDFILLFLVLQGNGRAVVSSRFPRVIPRVERFSLDLLLAVKKYRECALELGCGG